MRADPDPEQSLIDVDRKCSMVQPNASRAEAAHALEVQRRMLRILLEERVGTVGALSDFDWQGVVPRPERW